MTHPILYSHVRFGVFIYSVSSLRRRVLITDSFKYCAMVGFFAKLGQIAMGIALLIDHWSLVITLVAGHWPLVIGHYSIMAALVVKCEAGQALRVNTGDNYAYIEGRWNR